MNNRKILPVICGPDIADYSFARIFHESAGIRSLVITEFHRGPVENSSILDLRIVPKKTFLSEEQFITMLRGLAAEFPDYTLLLFVNSDQGVEYVTKHRSELEPRWFLPFASYETVARANSKDRMATLYARLGLAVPKREIVDLTQPDTWETALSRLTFPIVVKPESGRDLDENRHLGLCKVLPVDAMPEALATLKRWHDAGVAVSLIVQELIPGDDTTQWVVNGYVDRQGRVTACGSGRVLLGLHAPELIGNAGLIFLEKNDNLIEAAQRVVTELGFTGFFSFDVKVDPRDGTEYWLDLNPRIGRSHYYLKVGGIDMARAVINDIVNKEPEYQTNTTDGVYAVLPGFLINSRYIRDPELLARVKKVTRRRRPINPLAYPHDRHPRRTIYRLENLMRQWRLLKQWYPEPTETGL